VADALDAAARALTRRDRSEADLRRILAAKGIAEADADDALAALRRSGALDDERFAARSAEALARRGFGDAAIRFRLQREGVEAELAERAVASLDPESGRAAALAARRGARAKTARWLTGRGFEAESVEHALRVIAEEATAELG
jgi:SOS response regulatory protein OraA/RecX